MVSEAELLALTPGKDYRITHLRKGEFVAVVLGTERHEDKELLLDVMIPTGNESGQGQLANGFVIIGGKKQRPGWSQKLLRRSLILSAVLDS